MRVYLHTHIAWNSIRPAISTNIDDSDIIIVGGGIVGLSIAYYLSEKTEGKITVVERSQPASQASKGNAGAISYFGIHPNRLVLKPLIDLSLKLFEQLSRRVKFDFEKSSSILVPQSSERDSVHRLAKTYSDVGVAAQVVENTELREISPLLAPNINSAVLFPEEARGNSAKLCEGLVRKLVENGHNVLRDTAATGFEVKNSTVAAVKTDNGRIRVRCAVVLAAGPWCRSLGEAAGLRIPIEPAKGHMVSFYAVPQRLGPTVIGKDIVVVQSNDGRIRSGGFVDMVGFDDKPDTTRIRSVLEQTFDLLPVLRSNSVTEEWVGLRPRTPDDLPILGKSPSIRNLFVATGHFKKGFCLSQVTGLLMSEIITGRKPSLSLEAFCPDRFNGH